MKVYFEDIFKMEEVIIFLLFSGGWAGRINRCF